MSSTVCAFLVSMTVRSHMVKIKTMSKRIVSHLGVNLQRLRKKIRLSQDALSQRAGVRREVIARLETGVRTGAHEETVGLLAKALGVSRDELARTHWVGR
jgi:DNA-binding XRE family transcriptional regulator